MANKPLKSIKFPGLSDTYTVPEIDNTLSVTGKAADAKKVGDELALKANSTAVTTQIGNAIAENIDNRLVTSGKAADAKKVGDELALKANTSSLPTKVSELTNDSNFQTKTQVDTALANKIDNTLSVTGKAADAGKTGEAIADLKEDLNNTMPIVASNNYTVGVPIEKVGTDITLSDVVDFGALSSARIYGKTIQANGTPTPSARLPITSSVSQDSSGKYAYTIQLRMKDGSTIEKSVLLDDPLYDDDYIDVFSAKLYRHTAIVKLDGSRTYIWQEFGSNARFMTAAEKAVESGTGACDGFAVNTSPITQMTVDNSISCYSGGTSLFFIFHQYASGDAVKAYFASNPMLYLYKKATPTITNVPELEELKSKIAECVRLVSNVPIKIIYTAKSNNGGYAYVNRRVGYTTKGDYTSILRALKETPYETTIIVGRGTYDIVQEYEDYYGSDFWTNYSGYGDGKDKFLRGLWVAFGRRILFDPFARVVFNYTGNNSAVKYYFSPFATGGNGEICGLHLEFNNGCRYAVHDDFAESDGIFVYKNCMFNGQAQSDTLGAGCGQSNQYIIDNCIFLGSTSQDHDDISYHNSGFSSGKCFIVVKDCYCENGIHFKWYGQSTDITECIVTNCKARRIICGPHIATPHEIENMMLYAWNNVVDE